MRDETPNAPRNLDMTTQQLADRVARAISEFTAATAYRLATSPAAPVATAEIAAFDEMRAALHDMATTEYDRGYRTAVRIIRKEKPDV